MLPLNLLLQLVFLRVGVPPPSLLVLSHGERVLRVEALLASPVTLCRDWLQQLHCLPRPALNTRDLKLDQLLLDSQYLGVSSRPAARTTQCRGVTQLVDVDFDFGAMRVSHAPADGGKFLEAQVPYAKIMGCVQSGTMQPRAEQATATRCDHCDKTRTGKNRP